MRLTLEQNADGTAQLVVVAPLSQLSQAADLARALETLCGGAPDPPSPTPDEPGEFLAESSPAPEKCPFLVTK